MFVGVVELAYVLLFEVLTEVVHVADFEYFPDIVLLSVREPRSTEQVSVLGNTTVTDRVELMVAVDVLVINRLSVRDSSAEVERVSVTDILSCAVQVRALVTEVVTERVASLVRLPRDFDCR